MIRLISVATTTTIRGAPDTGGILEKTAEGGPGCAPIRWSRLQVTPTVVGASVPGRGRGLADPLAEVANPGRS